MNETFRAFLSGLIFVAAIFAVSIWFWTGISTDIENRGGIRNIIVGAGKEVKSIVEDINNDSTYVDSTEAH
jgi:hypothetical protein